MKMSSIDSERIALLKMSPFWNKCDRVEGSILLEMGWLKTGLVAHSVFLLLMDPVVELLVTSASPCLPAYHHHASPHDNNGLNLFSLSQPRLNDSFHKCSHGHGISSQQ